MCVFVSESLPAGVVCVCVCGYGPASVCVCVWLCVFVCFCALATVCVYLYQHPSRVCVSDACLRVCVCAGLRPFAYVRV